MKENKKNIIYAWLLLLFFAAGQYLVFAHQHYKQGHIISANKTNKVLKEKCSICDVMHHTQMLITQHAYFTPVVAVLCHYQLKKHDVKPVQLVLAAGRAPPVS